MIRTVPGDEPLLAVVNTSPKTNEGLHLVRVSPDLFFPRLREVDVVIGRDFQEPRLAVGQTPQHAIKQIPAFRLTMTG